MNIVFLFTEYKLKYFSEINLINFDFNKNPLIIKEIGLVNRILYFLFFLMITAKIHAAGQGEFTHHTIQSIIQLQSDNSIFLVGLEWNEKIHGGVKISNDYGKTWKTIKDFDNKAITKIVEDEKNRIWICTEIDGLFLSQDKGESWKKINTMTPVNDIEFDRETVWISHGYNLNMQKWFKDQGHGVSKSIDDGKTFFNYSMKYGIPANNVRDILITEQDKVIISTDVGLAEYVQKKNRFLKLKLDDKRLKRLLPTYQGIKDRWGFGKLYQTRQNDILLGFGYQVFASRDSGLTWRLLSSVNGQVFQFFEHGDYIFIATSLGVHQLSYDYKLINLYNILNGIKTNSVFAFYVDNKNNYWIGTGSHHNIVTQGLFFSNNQGTSWTEK